LKDKRLKSVASFAVEACRADLGLLKHMNQEAMKRLKAVDAATPLQWNADQVNIAVKDAVNHLNTLNEMLRSARLHFGEKRKRRL